jgi:hypothetical protein
MANEYFVFNNDAFTNKGVARNLAASANDRVFLDFDEGANLGFIADGTAVKIYKTEQLDIASELYVVRHSAKITAIAHRKSPFILWSAAVLLEELVIELGRASRGFVHHRGI